ncbi:MAG: hypothetical protein Q7R76_01720, partial [Candidatus Woesearchaeota archaeon]|nr:hypothetical protein [Candidatus Woesearchaeota archaeon]
MIFMNNKIMIRTTLCAAVLAFTTGCTTTQPAPESNPGAHQVTGFNYTATKTVVPEADHATNSTGAPTNAVVV